MDRLTIELLTLLIAFIIFGIIAPLWGIKTCAISLKQHHHNKLIWLMLMIFFWPIAQIVFAYKQKHWSLLITFTVSGVILFSALIYLFYKYKHILLQAI